MAKKWDWPLKGLTSAQKAKSGFADGQRFGDARAQGIHDGLDFGDNTHPRQS